MKCFALSIEHRGLFSFRAQAAKKVAAGKWSIGAVGNLANVPHTNHLN